MQTAYSPQEFAEEFGISRATVYNELAAGRLKSKKRGRSTLIYHDHGVEWFEALPDREVVADGREVG